MYPEREEKKHMKRHQLKSCMKTEVEHGFNLQSRKETAQNQGEKEKKKNIPHKL